MPDIYDAFERLGLETWDDAAEWLYIRGGGPVLEGWLEARPHGVPEVTLRCIRLVMGLMDRGMSQRDVGLRMVAVPPSVREPRIRRPKRKLKPEGAGNGQGPGPDPPPPLAGSGDGTQMEPLPSPLTGREFQRLTGLLNLGSHNSIAKWYGVSVITIKTWFRKGPTALPDRLSRLCLNLLEEGIRKDDVEAMMLGEGSEWRI